MQPGARNGSRFGAAILGGVSVAAITAATLIGQYSMTVNRDRLVNAQNEPQNWLMMNGDYASTRYSKLSQINRDNVKDLRMVWGLALGGMQAALAADISGMSKAVTERIWLAFGVVTYTSVALLRGRQARVALVGAAVSTLLVNHLLDTGS